MELTRENLVNQIRKTVTAHQKIVSISLSDSDFKEISNLVNEGRTFEVLFGYPLNVGPHITTSTLNIALQDDYDKRTDSENS